MARSKRRRWMLIGAAALLAFAVGVGRAILEEPPEARPPAREPVPAPAEPAAPSPSTLDPSPRAETEPLAAPPDPRRGAIRARLEHDLAVHFPELKLSSDEVDAAADALVRLRAARLALHALPRTPENGERVRELVREIGRAYEDFEYVIELDPAEFTERVDPGIDPDEEEVAQ